MTIYVFVNDFFKLELILNEPQIFSALSLYIYIHFLDINYVGNIPPLFFT